MEKYMKNETVYFEFLDELQESKYVSIKYGKQKNIVLSYSQSLIEAFQLPKEEAEMLVKAWRLYCAFNRGVKYV